MIIKLQNVRLAFPELFEPKSVNGEGTPAYSASFLLPKNHPQIKEIEEAIAEVATAKWGPKAPAILKQLKAGDKVLLHDGDNKSEYDGYAGNYYISSRNRSRPLVVDRDRTPLTSADGKPYAGCYVNSSIEVWAQDNNYGKRINASLRGVQFFKDGDAFAGGAPASGEEFDDIADGADAEALA